MFGRRSISRWRTIGHSPDPEINTALSTYPLKLVMAQVFSQEIKVTCSPRPRSPPQGRPAGEGGEDAAWPVVVGAFADCVLQGVSEGVEDFSGAGSVVGWGGQREGWRYFLFPPHTLLSLSFFPSISVSPSCCPLFRLSSPFSFLSDFLFFNFTIIFLAFFFLRFSACFLSCFTIFTLFSAMFSIYLLSIFTLFSFMFYFHLIFFLFLQFSTPPYFLLCFLF